MSLRVTQLALLLGLSVSAAGCARRTVPASRPAPPARAVPPVADSAAVVVAPGPAPAAVPAPAPPPPRTPPPAVPRELRAVWVATVDNIDWPSRQGLSTWEQQRELVAILDKCVELRLNAVILQVRPSADALYDSRIEPWSDFLSGQLGRAPEPYYDPLAFAVDEAHKRGLELHAWINPYRARHPATKTTAPDHISQANPELVRTYGSFLWMDPGDPVVRNRTMEVALDIVRRYDIDALHMDDYFYPYPEVRNGRELEFPDDATYSRYRRRGGTLARDDWRRENVNTLVKDLYEGVHAVKPWVRFGLSPFGIWRPGYPASVRGLDQYAVLYADARKWLREGWVDYFTPQLYWAVDRPQQRYDELLRWWTEQNLKGRHIWPGNYTGKVAFTTASAWRTNEILEQIRLTRAQRGATGNVHFSMKVFQQNPDALNERLLAESYAQPALVPGTPWLGSGAPARPLATARTDLLSGELVLELGPGSPPPRATGGAGPAFETTAAPRSSWLWVVQSYDGAGWTTRILPGAQRTHVLAARGTQAPSHVRVTAIDRLGTASEPALVTPRR